jgi:hypothetical protein
MNRLFMSVEHHLGMAAQASRVVKSLDLHTMLLAAILEISHSAPLPIMTLQ